MKAPKGLPKALYVALAGAMIVIVVFVTLGFLQSNQADELVPPGTVVSTTELWRGTTETSLNGKGLSAELQVESGATPNDAPQAVLINTGEVPFAYGNGHTMDRLSRGFWEPVEDHSVYTTALHHLIPGNRAEPETLKVTPRFNSPSRLLSPGEYRVTKSFEIDSGDPHQARPFEVSARFLVE